VLCLVLVKIYDNSVSVVCLVLVKIYDNSVSVVCLVLVKIYDNSVSVVCPVLVKIYGNSVSVVCLVLVKIYDNSVSIVCLVLVKIYGNNPRKLFVKIVRNSEIRINEFAFLSYFLFLNSLHDGVGHRRHRHVKKLNVISVHRGLRQRFTSFVGTGTPALTNNVSDLDQQQPINAGWEVM